VEQRPGDGGGLGANTAQDQDRRGLAIVVVVLTVLASCTSVLPVFGPRIIELYSITAEEFGGIMGLRNLGRIPSLLLVGPLIALLGARRVAEIALWGVAAAYLILGMGQSLLALRWSFLILGVFLGLFSIAIPALLISLFPTRKRGMFSINLVALALPSIFYPPLAGQLVDWTAGDAGNGRAIFIPFIIVGSMLAVGTCYLFFWSRNARVDASTAEEPKMPADASFLSAIRTRLWEVVITLCSFRSLLIMILICLHGSADNTVYTFLPLFMKAGFENVSATWTAWAVSAHGLAYVITRTILSVAPEGSGQRAILTLAGPLGGSLVILTLWYSPVLAIPLLYLLASMLFAAEFPTLASEVSSRSMGGFGTVLATGMVLSEIATFRLQKFTGSLADETGDYRVALSVASCGFIAFGIIALVSGLGRKNQADS